MPSASSDPDDAFHAAGRAFEEHERELVEKLRMAVQRRIPKGATVDEAIAEMRRATAEDEDVRELLLRVAVIQSQNAGYIRSHLEAVQATIPEFEPRYRLACQSLSAETLKLMRQFSGEVERRLPPDLSEEEREACVLELLSEHQSLTEMAERLEKLMERDGFFRSERAGAEPLDADA